MELRQLRYFVAIAEHGSFSKAALTVNVAQSALSHQLALLEQELGTKLLNRLPRGVSMTEAGYVFHAHALSVLRRVEDAKMSVHGFPDEPRGRVSVGLPSSVCHALASALLQSVRTRLPQVELEMSEQASGALAAHLQAGTINLAVLFDDADLSRFISRPMVEEALYYISRNPVPSSENGFVTLEQALEGPLVLASQQQGVRRIVESYARQSGVRQPSVVAELNSVNILRAALVAGIGNTILPPMSLRQELSAGMLYGCRSASRRSSARSISAPRRSSR